MHSSSNGPGRARLLLKIITIEMFGPVGPKIGPTGPKISIVLVIGPDSAEPGLLLLLCAFSLCSEVCSDVSLAILFDVALAEARMCPIGAYMCHRGRRGWSRTSPDDPYDTYKRQ